VVVVAVLVRYSGMAGLACLLGVYLVLGEKLRVPMHVQYKARPVDMVKWAGRLNP